MSNAKTRPAINIRKLQAAVLRELGRHGFFHLGCGWAWGSSYQTVKTLQVLEEKGLVEQKDTDGLQVWTMTTLGKKVLETL
jgi:hypothetical protein